MITRYEDDLDLVIILPSERVVGISFLDPTVAITSIPETTNLPIGPYQDHVLYLHLYSWIVPHKPEISASTDNPLDTPSSQLYFQETAASLFWWFCRAQKIFRN